MKKEDYKNKETYTRGRDYPCFDSENIKMSMGMSGKEIKKRFTDEELKEYPRQNGYTGSLP